MDRRLAERVVIFEHNREVFIELCLSVSGQLFSKYVMKKVGRYTHDVYSAFV